MKVLVNIKEDGRVSVTTPSVERMKDDGVMRPISAAEWNAEVEKLYDRAVADGQNVVVVDDTTLPPRSSRDNWRFDSHTKTVRVP